MFKHLNISSKLLVLVGVLLTGMLFIGAYGLHSLGMAQQAAEQALGRKQAIADAVIASRAAEVAFKIQVQEWKNILLRGHEPADYDRYLAAFQQRSEAVRKDMEVVDRAMANLGLADDTLESARKLHAE